MIYDVSHVNRVHYDPPVQLAQFNIRMEPIDWPDQQLISHRLVIEPRAIVREIASSPLTKLTRVRIERPIESLSVESHFKVRVTRAAPVPASDDPPVAAVRDAALAVQSLDALAPANFLYPSSRVPLDTDIAGWCGKSLEPERGVVEACLDLARRIQAGFTYDPDATEVDTPVADAFAARHGVCQDFAHIMLSGLRAFGIPAAYVSGFLRTIPPPGKARLVGADATHAWVLAWCGAGRGWLGFDPTNGVTVGADHIVAAIGRDFTEVSPMDGIFIGGKGQELDVAVDVVPLEEVSEAGTLVPQG